MSGSTTLSWQRFNELMLGACAYVLLAVATALGVAAGNPDPAWRLTTIAIAAIAAGWIFFMYTWAAAPRQERRLRMGVFFVGVLALASILMLRQPLFFVFMISGFFYASALRPLPLAVVGVGATSILVNTLIAGLPTVPEAWTFYVVIIVIQTAVIGGGVIAGEKIAAQSEERRRALARLETALVENAGLHAQLLTQAREAGVLQERGRMAGEIHDTIAQGLTGIITQIQAADQSRDKPGERDRHLGNAMRLARESLTEARRSVEASMPAALDAGTLPEALKNIAHDWAEMNGTPVDVTVTGDVIALHPDIEVALLRTAQEALANVAKHAGATRAGLTISFIGDVVTLDVRDDGVGFIALESGAVGGSGFGLTAMRQRVARVAGSLTIESEPGGGTAVSARVPAIAAGSSAVTAT